MKFWKMNGAGNDFIIINNMEEKISVEKFPYIAKTLCERHLSIGADGFMAVEKPSNPSEADYAFADTVSKKVWQQRCRGLKLQPEL